MIDWKFLISSGMIYAVCAVLFVCIDYFWLSKGEREWYWREGDIFASMALGPLLLAIIPWFVLMCVFF